MRCGGHRERKRLYEFRNGTEWPENSAGGSRTGILHYLKQPTLVVLEMVVLENLGWHKIPLVLHCFIQMLLERPLEQVCVDQACTGTTPGTGQGKGLKLKQPRIG